MGKLLAKNVFIHDPETGEQHGWFGPSYKGNESVPSGLVELVNNPSAWADFKEAEADAPISHVEVDELPDDLEELSKADLVLLAEGRGLEVTSHDTKADIIETLLAAGSE